MPSHVRQDHAVDALRAQHVHVIQLCQLLRLKRLGRAEHHLPRVVNHHVDPPVGLEDPFNRGIHRSLRLHVHFHSPQLDAIVLREVADRLNLRRVAAVRVPHRRINPVAG